MRERQGLSTATLASRAELSASWLSDVEQGLGDPSWGELRRLAGGLRIPLPELMRQVEEFERDLEGFRRP